MARNYWLNKKVIFTVLVAAFGYFVDIYDLILFSIVRIPSLRSLGIAEDLLLPTGVKLLNCQMIGMLLGGILWGVLGDKRGRVSVLFGSILIYSLANLANAFVGSVETYAFWRFVAGIGLAGELGAAITLISETMSKETRGYGTTFVATIGASGGVVAGFTANLLSWQMAYILGGCLGLMLLATRMGLSESVLYQNSSKNRTVRKGSLQLLLGTRKHVFTYLYCILIGTPIWFAIGILVTFSPELSKEIGVVGSVQPGVAILLTYAGLTVGDLASGLLSQYLKNRRKAVFIFLSLTVMIVLLFLFSYQPSLTYFYTICFALGFATGYWTLFATIAAEQFGTNLRATVATTVPNFVRGSVVLLTSGFSFLHLYFSLVTSAFAVGVISLSLAFWAVYKTQETFAKDLDFVH